MRVLVTGGADDRPPSATPCWRGATRSWPYPPPGTGQAEEPDPSWHAWQPTTERPPAEALEGVEGVVNLVGEEINQRLTDQAKVRIRESRLIGTETSSTDRGRADEA